MSKIFGPSIKDIRRQIIANNIEWQKAREQNEASLLQKQSNQTFHPFQKRIHSCDPPTPNFMAAPPPRTIQKPYTSFSTKKDENTPPENLFRQELPASTPSLAPIPRVAHSSNVPFNMPPELFTGKENANIWLSRFQRYCLAYGWSDLQAALNFPLLLRDQAAVWFETLSADKEKDIKSIFIEFRGRFLPHAASEFHRLSTLLERKQQQGENVNEFIQYNILEGRDLQQSEISIMRNIIRNLNPSIAQPVIEAMPESLEQAIDLARKAEAIRSHQAEDDESNLLSLLTEKVNLLESTISVELNRLEERLADALQSAQETRALQSSHENLFTNASCHSEIPLKRPTPLLPSLHAPFHSHNQHSYHQASRYYKKRHRRNSRHSEKHINTPCARCGDLAHTGTQCHYLLAQCKHCKKVGHLSSVYRKRQTKQCKTDPDRSRYWAVKSKTPIHHSPFIDIGSVEDQCGYPSPYPGVIYADQYVP